MSQCPKCKSFNVGQKQVGKDGPNKGKWFISCNENGCKGFQWIATPSTSTFTNGPNQNSNWGGQSSQYVNADAYRNVNDGGNVSCPAPSNERTFGQPGRSNYNPNESIGDGDRPVKRFKGDSQPTDKHDNKEEELSRFLHLLPTIKEITENVRNTLLLYDEVFKLGAIYALNPDKFQALIAKRAGLVLPSNNNDEDTQPNTPTN